MRITLVKTLAVGVAIAGLGAVLAYAGPPPATPQGVITAKVYYNIGGGTAVTDLTGNDKYKNDTPDTIRYEPYFEIWAVGDIGTAPAGDIYNNYGAELSGYFYPQTDGDYTFYITSDDASELWLSTDSTPANRKLIARETNWSNPRNYTADDGDTTGSATTNKNSSTFGGTQWPTKDPANGGAKITLDHTKVYYIQALMKEGGGGDNVSVSIDGTAPIPGSMLSSVDKSTGNVAITNQPVTVTVNEGQPAFFKVGSDGTPPISFQWTVGTTAVSDGTNYFLFIPRVYRAQNNSVVKVTVTGAAGSPVTSDGVAKLIVNNDTTPPVVTNATASADFKSITLQFNEPLDPTTAQAGGSYKVDNGVTVSAAALAGAAGTANDNTVILTTSLQPGSTTMTVTIDNVKDVPGNVIAAATKVTVKSFTFATGWATYQRWDNNAGGGDIATFDTAYFAGTAPTPNFSSAINQFDGPWGVADNYNSVHFAWFIPPSNGNYIFWLASDDASNLYLSEDDTAAKLHLIAQEGGWSNEYQWIAVGNGDATTKRSDQFAGSLWTPPNTITLVGGNKYYMVITHHEGGGGDGAGATFTKAGDPDPVQSATALKGKVIGTYLDPSGAAVNITQQPQDVQGVDGKIVRFNVVATGTSKYGSTIGYQWQKASPNTATFADIPGANLDSYQTLVALTDKGTQYRVILSVPTLDQPSAAAHLDVIADTFPPIVKGATAIKGSTKIGVAFDEDLDVASAQTAANYKVDGVTPTSAVVRTNVANEARYVNEKNLVQLTMPTAVNADFVLKVNGVKDAKGNAMTAEQTANAKLSPLTSTGVGSLAPDAGSPDPQVPATITTWGPGNYDVLCNGNDYWNNADGMNFLWEAKTNSFDVKVRVVSVSPIDNWSAGAIEVREGPATDNGKGWELARHYFIKTDYGGENTVCLDSTSATGANQYEFNARLAKGDPTQREIGNSGQGQGRGDWGGAPSLGDSPPAPTWPNAWIRIAREKTASSDHLKGYWSTDGVTWHLRKDVDLNDATHAGYLDDAGNATGPMPDVLYVGLASVSHTGVGNGNASNDGTGGTNPDGTATQDQCWYSPVGSPYMAYIIYRDYGDVTPSSGGGQPHMTAAKNANGSVTITWTGTGKLQSRASLNSGAWADVANVTGNSYTVTPAGNLFYQIAP